MGTGQGKGYPGYCTVTQHDPLLPDCLICGACCAPPYGELLTYVEVSDADRARMPPEVRALVEDGELRTVSRPGGVACAALKGTLGQSVHCAIYPVRPQACRRIRRGSIHCFAARREVLGWDCERMLETEPK